MKKIFTLLVAASIGTMAFGQVVFQSNFDSWTTGTPPMPSDFDGAKTNINPSDVTKITTGAQYGANTVKLENSTTSGKRLSTQPVAVTDGTTYEMKFWAKGSGELGTRLWAGNWNPSIVYETINSSTLTMYTRTITSDSTFSSAEFIFYVKNTTATNNHIEIDSVHIGTGTPPPPPSGFTSIYDIQFTTNPNGNSPEENNIVTTKGVVTAYVNNTANFGAGSFFIQDGDGAWNGLYIYNQDTLQTPSVGDSVEVTGTISEFNLGSAPEAVTELTSISNLTVINSGNTLPNTTTISTADANSEDYEGVLIKVVGASATAVGSTLGFGLWEMNDGSGALKGDDDMYAYHLQAIQGTKYDVTGIGHYSFDDYKILPRKTSDVALFTGVDELSGVAITVYPNPVRDAINFKLDVAGFNVNIVDITGKSVKTASSLNNKLSVETSNLNNGIYFYSISDFDGNLISTNKFIVAK